MTVRQALPPCIVVAFASALACAVAVSAPALAAEPLGDRAVALKKRGDEAMAAGHYTEALAHYEAAQEVSPNPALHYNRGRALERLARFALAVRAYEQFIAEASPDVMAKTPTLPSHVAELRERTTMLRLKVAPSGAAVKADGRELGTAPFAKAVRVDAGTVRFVVTAPRCEPAERTLILKGGTEDALTVALACEGAPIAAGPAPAPTESSGSLLSSPWFWTAAGVVVVAGAVAVVFAVTTERDAGQGDIAPGRVSAPLLRF